jgi:hypothetical protein
MVFLVFVIAGLIRNPRPSVGSRGAGFAGPLAAPP